MAAKTTTSPESLCQLKITLKWSNPPIWRRVLVRRDMSLDLIHDVIEHEDMLEWLSEDFDPKAFDLDQVNKFLRKIALKPTS